MLQTPPAIELPLWQCHKTVRAQRIDAISEDGLTLTLHGGYEFKVEPAWIKRHEAKVGGYLVVYEDGYVSFSPKDAFLGGYTQVINTL